LCISWWIKKTLIISRCTVCMWKLSVIVYNLLCVISNIVTPTLLGQWCSTRYYIAFTEIPLKGCTFPFTLKLTVHGKDLLQIWSYRQNLLRNWLVSYITFQITEFYLVSITKVQHIHYLNLDK
jgi:hypothetical protein